MDETTIMQANATSILDNDTMLNLSLLFQNACIPKILPYQGFYETAQFVTGLVLYPTLCIIGITGNILSLVVLLHKDMSTSTNVYLSALSVSDIIKLLNDWMYFVVTLIVRSGDDKGSELLAHMYPYAHYIFNMSVCVTGWLTVSVAVERYISICHPTRAKQLCTIYKAKVVSTVVFITMSLLAIPSAMRYKAVTKYNETCNKTEVVLDLTELGHNHTFQTAYQWILNLTRSIIPLIVLVFLNYRIISEVGKERIKGKALSSKNKITMMLIVIIIVFLVCITPDAIMSTVFQFGYYDENYMVKGIREITDTLLAVNSAFNFVLYCSMSKIFRDTFLKIFCKCRSKPKKSAQQRPLLNGKESKNMTSSSQDSPQLITTTNKATFV